MRCTASATVWVFCPITVTALQLEHYNSTGDCSDSGHWCNRPPADVHGATTGRHPDVGRASCQRDPATAGPEGLASCCRVYAQLQGHSE